MADEKLYGWMGKLLWIDLANRTWRYEDTTELDKEYIGPRSIAAKLAWDHIPPGTKPFDDENPIIFYAGPMTGTAAFSSGRVGVFTVGAQQYPEHFTRSYIGGHVNVNMKRVGLDGFVLQGKSSEPVVLEITEDAVIFHDGAPYWGMLTHDLQKKIYEDWGPDAHAYLIGPAGENKVRIAAIEAGLDASASQTGVGAVMGDKKVKAIFFSGMSHGVKVADPEEIVRLRDRAFYLKNIPYEPNKPIEKIEPFGGTRDTMAWGTEASGIREPGVGGFGATTEELVEAGIIDYHNSVGNMCIGCGSICHVAGYTFIKNVKAPYPVEGHDRMTIGLKCASDVNRGFYAVTQRDQDHLLATVGRDYRYPYDYARGAECSWQIANYGMNAWEVVAMWGWLVDLEGAGVDMDEFLGIHWDVDDPTLFPRILEMIAYRRGIGDFLAEGIARCAYELGGVYLEHTHHVAHGCCEHSMGTDSWFGLKYPYWVFSYLSFAVDYRDPIADSGHRYYDFCGNRNHGAMAYGPAKAFYGAEYAIGPDPKLRKFWGGDMDDDEFDDLAYRDKEIAVKKHQKRGVMIGDGTLCDSMFPLTTSARPELDYYGDFDLEAQMLTAVTGIPITTEEWEDKSERTLTLQRCYSILEYGRDKASDMEFCWHGRPRGDWTSGKKLDPVRFGDLLGRYYALMGWDEDGVPTDETLRRLGLDFCIERMDAYRERKAVLKAAEEAAEDAR